MACSALLLTMTTVRPAAWQAWRKSSDPGVGSVRVAADFAVHGGRVDGLLNVWRGVSRRPPQDDEWVVGVEHFGWRLAVGGERLTHPVGDHAVAAIDEQVGDGAVEVEQDRPGRSENGGQPRVGHGCHGRAMVVQMLSNHRLASLM